MVNPPHQTPQRQSVAKPGTDIIQLSVIWHYISMLWYQLLSGKISVWCIYPIKVRLIYFQYDTISEWYDIGMISGLRGIWYQYDIYNRAGVKYVLSNTNTNTNTKIWIFQIQIQIFCSTLIQIQIQIQIHRFKYKYKYKYVQPNISAETVQIQNRAILWIPRYMLMACVSLCLGDTWS